MLHGRCRCNMHRANVSQPRHQEKGTDVEHGLASNSLELEAYLPSKLGFCW